MPKNNYKMDLNSVIQIRKLDKVSGFFFLLGFIVSKVQYLPNIIFVSLINIFSLSCYFLAYGAWFISSHFNPSQKNNDKEWYEFAQFKEQFLYAAAIGLVASFISISAIYLPTLLVPASWLFLLSNILWTIGEYNKLKNPAETDENYSHTYQNANLNYAMTMTVAGLTTAIATTLIFIFPPITVPVIIASAIINTGLGMLAAEYWCDYTFGEHKKTPVQHSYTHLNESLSPTNEPEKTNFPQPYQGVNPLKNNSVQKKINDEETDLLNQSFTLRQ